MNFKKKLKVRLYFAIGFTVLGLLLMLVFNIFSSGNEYISTFGFAMIIVGIVRIRSYVLIPKTEETIKKQQIVETDERNIAIANKAKSVSFIIYILIASVAVIVFQFLNKPQISYIISLTVSVLVLIYWISYWIIRKKS